MSFTWHEIRDHLLRSTTSLGFQRNFAAIRSSQASLIRFGDPAAVFGFLHDPKHQPESKNRILTALVVAAQFDDRRSDCALTLTLLALWPGLDAVHGRLRRYFRARPDDLAAEIASRASITVRTLDLTRVTKIAATLIRNVERDIRRSLIRFREEASSTIAFDDDTVAIAPGFPADICSAQGETLPCIHDRLREVIGDDARLVLAVVIEGHSQREAADLFGIGHEAARKRFQRALARLRDASPDFLRRDVPVAPYRRLFDCQTPLP